MSELTGYEDHQLDRVEEILDGNPSTSAEVYRSTIDLDPRAVAAVAAKRAGGGSGSLIGTSYLIVSGVSQAGIGAGFNTTVVYDTVDSSAGEDVEVRDGDHSFIDVVTTGWYQLTAFVGIGGAGITTMQLKIITTSWNFDDYPAADGANFGGCDLVLTTPVMPLTEGDFIRVTVAADGTGNWNLEATPNRLYIMRFA